jgi:SulP family sulfate permease
LAALAGILLVLAVRMFDWSSFRLLRQRSTWFDFAVAGAVVVTAVAWDLVAAAGVGVILAMLLFIRDQMHSSVVRRKIYGGKVSSRQKRLPEEAAILAQEGGKIAIFELQGSLFFGTTDQLFTEVEPEFALRRYFIFDMRRVLSVDFTAVHMLEMIESRLAEKGGRLLFADIAKTSPTGQDLELYFGQLGLTAPTKRVHLFPTLDDAFIWAEDRILAKHVKPAAPDELLALSDIELVKGMEPELVAALAGCVHEKSFAAGEALFQQGDPSGDEMFLIRRGKVRIDLDLAGAAGKHLATIGKGDFLGEMAFLDRAGRSATAKAVTPVDCFVLSRSCFDVSAPQHPDLGRKFFWRLSRALSARLRSADAEIRVLYEA